jgi:hypothetical protein
MNKSQMLIDCEAKDALFFRKILEKLKSSQI